MLQPTYEEIVVENSEQQLRTLMFIVKNCDPTSFHLFIQIFNYSVIFEYGWLGGCLLGFYFIQGCPLLFGTN